MFFGDSMELAAQCYYTESGPSDKITYGKNNER